ncbi:unnamed protein product [Acanthoscelides obtectus]|uniref:CCHC-type domain-containing protein n=1 Tax=Acanthoscelides obtectus TaxID=200917 RepID=A0A9P0Q5I9_ACAOB|nr:unnamed protein product [Acanthoscelides obtectus]CAK1629769.1 hypothetical protein AOBTE_LOCUS5940 [Acanthoscelides obtectus]
MANFTLFADGTTVSHTANSFERSMAQSLAAQDEAELWFCSNKLLLNKDKTKIMVFSMRGLPGDSDLVGEAKFLGVTLDRRLQWVLHIDSVAGKATKDLNIGVTMLSLNWRGITEDLKQKLIMCFNCQALGHTAGNCQKEKICPCGNPPHEGPCPEPKKCVNCEGPHSAAYMNCPKLKAEAAIQKVKVTENITYAEAKRKVNITTPKPTTSYSAAVQKSSEMNIQQIISRIIPHIETAVRNAISCSTSKCDHFKAPSSGLIFRRDRSDSVSTNLSAASEKRKKPGDSTTDDDSSAMDPNSNPTKKRGRPKRTAPPLYKLQQPFYKTGTDVSLPHITCGTEKLSELNLQLQRRDKELAEMISDKAFFKKLEFWEQNLIDGDTSHFPVV